MTDPTEFVRRLMVDHLNTSVPESEADARAQLEAYYGRVWSTSELGADFEVLGFLAPFVHVRRKADGVTGTMIFTHSPRFYFNFTAV
jgi:hypothetical protein